MIGKSLGHYEILRSLGSGGMGEVWAARDVKLDREVALKLLPAAMAGDPERLARFEREAKAVAALDHPNIVTIYSIEEAEGSPFITMQLVEGRTLAQLLEARGGEGLSLRELFDLAIPLAAAVGAAHDSGIAHRDLKPANVMVTPTGRVLVLDFGLAKMIAVGEDESTVALEEVLTQEGKILGTIAYMSPEQAEGRAVDERSDLFSLGVMLYELCTGKRPFVGDTQMSVLTSIIRDEPVPVTEVREALPRHLGRIIEHCLQKDPAERLQSATDLRTMLEQLRREVESGSYDSGGISRGSGSVSAERRGRKPTPSGGSRRFVLPIVIAAVVVIVAVIGGTWVDRSRDEAARVSRTLGELTALAEQGRLDELDARLRADGIDLDDPGLAELAAQVGGTLSLSTEPPAAGVELRRVTPASSFEGRAAVELTTPATQRVVAGAYHLTLTSPRTEPLTALVDVPAGDGVALERRLTVVREGLEGMLVVDAGPSPLDAGVPVPAFLIDRHEVTNAQYLEFVTAGGYRAMELWPERMVVAGGEQDASAVLSDFVDRTGIQGPRGWTGGTYPEGAGEQPVVEISWYEAAAYARWRGKRIPDRHQWWRAAVGEDGRALPWGNDVAGVELRANFGGVGTLPVGSLPLGVGPYGCLDMAGNVREWLDEGRDGVRATAGGAWNDPTYMFDPSAMEFFPRTYLQDSIGFRLVAPLETER